MNIRDLKLTAEELLAEITELGITDYIVVECQECKKKFFVNKSANGFLCQACFKQANSCETAVLDLCKSEFQKLEIETDEIYFTSQRQAGVYNGFKARIAGYTYHMRIEHLFAHQTRLIIVHVNRSRHAVHEHGFEVELQIEEPKGYEQLINTILTDVQNIVTEELVGKKCDLIRGLMFKRHKRDPDWLKRSTDGEKIYGVDMGSDHRLENIKELKKKLNDIRLKE
jgi:hypothetical protein